MSNEQPNYGDSMPEEVADRIGRRIAERIKAREADQIVGSPSSSEDAGEGPSAE